MVTQSIHKLTKRSIDSFVYAGGTDVRWDETIPGFGVRIYPSGKKAFILRYRAQGRKRLLTLGRFGADLTLEQARDRAKAHRVDVRDGKDPLEERKKHSQGKNFKELCDKYIQDHAKPHKKTWKTDESRLNRHIPASWNSRLVASINRDDVSALHARVGVNAPYEANRTLDLLRVIFEKAQSWYFMDKGTENPATGIKKFREYKRKRFVTQEELPALAKAIDKEQSIYVRSAMWLYLLTGLRKNELLRVKRSDIDNSRQMLRLPDTKSGEEQEVTLSASAMAIINAIPAEEKNHYLFPGRIKGKHIVNIDKAWRRVRKAAEVEDLQLHDLRRSVGSWLTQTGVDLNVIKSALRHSNIATTLIYARLGDDPAREAMEAHGENIMMASGKANLSLADDG
ncbi:site-specific integrase [Sneathiella marina]|uniref:Site-specific integrase n=1 Tax=Sneathiella marina TaxID=2950108 RepID=A0ABY4W3T0_9PROT|nr:site-specific integrase [Sneathiella marina]USG61484.1 site-specific integrase [Sneathiella marina]